MEKWLKSCKLYECEYYGNIERDHRDYAICRHPHNKTFEDKLTCSFGDCPLTKDYSKKGE